ncbi:BamA/TamA family outer membrane protein [Vibrio sp. 10N.261.55.A7]|uniref:BamA/TamA family outer membrane protein n=1 Tax=Vibrio sp. 10N.261.55.A7 TaxID=1880851 RepID=UPI000C836E94|nr:BamA/TamA family outer membrane protein [Vibrio sp. 10N.261.55.A7]PMJ92254.1 hypothetical protein BCU12_00690 [Vibrio sp. 10N.261.55.A7]
MKPNYLSLAFLLATPFTFANESEPETDAASVSEQQNIDTNTEDSSLWGRKFAILPAPVTDDALGNGLSLTAMYIHDRAAGTENPSISFAYGQYTDTQSGMLVLGHEHIFSHDEWRAGIYGGHFELNLNHYGSIGFVLPKPIKYTNGSSFTYGTVKKQIVEDLYVGLHGVWSGGSAKVANDPPLSPEMKNEFEQRMSGSSTAAGFLMTYDTRDKMMGATEGVKLDVSTMHYEDRNSGKPYHRIDADFSQFFPVADNNVFAYRLITEHLIGNVPDYEMVAPELRGVDWNKARGQSVYQAEVEYRHQITEKWSGVAFAGAAYVQSKKSSVQPKGASEIIPSTGVGIRYMLDPTERFSVGADVAVSKDGHTSYYIRFGEAF